MESKIDEQIYEKVHDPLFLPIIIEAFPLVILYLKVARLQNLMVCLIKGIELEKAFLLFLLNPIFPSQN